MHVSPLHVRGTVCWTQSQGYENTGYQAPPRLWDAASLSYPDTWGRKPDCLHLPYTTYLTTYLPTYLWCIIELCTWKLYNKNRTIQSARHNVLRCACYESWYHLLYNHQSHHCFDLLITLKKIAYLKKINPIILLNILKDCHILLLDNYVYRFILLKSFPQLT